MTQLSLGCIFILSLHIIGKMEKLKIKRLNLFFASVTGYRTLGNL